MPLSWETLFPLVRSGQSYPLQSQEYARSEFERDFDRIIFSSVFRRLQNKTQVYPLPGSVLVHNRLTHSLEVSSVGRSLGRMCGEAILQQAPELRSQLAPGDIGAIVAAAALAHDLGNPPFGHAGEEAISDFFINGYGCHFVQNLTEAQRCDFTNFEGNAHGFRLLANANPGNMPGGLRLTAATLLSFCKYPYHSAHSAQKCGYFQAEANIMANLAYQAQIAEYEKGCFFRHPLAFLVEAADDICYRIMDFEDAFRLQLVSFGEAENLLRNIAEDEIKLYDYHKITDKNERITYLRGRCINKLVHQVSEVFKTRMDKVLCADGVPEFSPLLQFIPAAQSQTLRELREVTRKQLYQHPHVLSMELNGDKQLKNLLSELIDAVLESPDLPKSKKIQLFIPQQFIQGHLIGDPATLERSIPGSGSDSNFTYIQLLNLVSFVAGMTDLYVLDFSQKLGIN